MEKLNFYIEPHDSFLEARIPDGFVHIFNGGNNFLISVFYKQESINLAEVDTIYKALDKANEWWNLVNQEAC